MGPSPAPDWPTLAVVGLGGAVGTSLRAGLAELIGPSPSGLPWATATANLVGALLLGLILGQFAAPGRQTARHRLIRLGLGTGLMGALTTYSTLISETLHLIDQGRAALGAAYLLGSLVAGLVLAGLGLRLSGLLDRSRHAGPTDSVGGGSARPEPT
ncbi:FluC/FEX family fluoride channel [Actinomyces sp. zg296]|uniref:FluC/FEX family fluoride channel n=1 Tax=Actinomyces sp. zg296 TaxID=2609289 RepID=UPI001358104D|nr:CrcB family protein [Actinomyces sp. zg296]